jgi:S-adenosyl-l-methionine decarboxylase leader peptide
MLTKLCVSFVLLIEDKRIDVLMESKGGKKKSSSSSNCKQYEAPLGYSIEDVRPAGGIKKFQSAAYSNVSLIFLYHFLYWCQLHTGTGIGVNTTKHFTRFKMF